MNKISIDAEQGSYCHQKVLEDTRAIEIASRGPSHPMKINGRPKVLVVDDEVAIRTIVKRSLEIQLHAEVQTAPNGEIATRLIEENSFDLIISDMQMPQMTGLELYLWIQINAPLLTERFFIISGDLGGSAVAEELHRHSVEVLKKPFLIERLLETTARYLPLHGKLEKIPA